MKLCSLLVILCLACNMFAEEKKLSEDERSKAESRADALIQAMAAQQAPLDEATEKQMAELDLLTRKAEAYVLVEQPKNARLMLSASQKICTDLKDDQRTSVRKALKGYRERHFVIAQSLYKHVAEADLSDKKKDAKIAENTEQSPVPDQKDPAPTPNTDAQANEDSSVNTDEE